MDTIALTKPQDIFSFQPPPEHADALKFLHLILPRAGWRCARNGWRGTWPGWHDKVGTSEEPLSNVFCVDDQALVDRCLLAAGYNSSFFVTATFKERGTAPQPGKEGKDYAGRENIHSRKCFHGDLDVGPVGSKKPYRSFEQAKDALLQVCQSLSLPKPILVKSGSGLHWYWPLKDPITNVNAWELYADGVIAALQEAGVEPDKCNDATRILRLPGTINHKRGQRLPVSLDAWGDGAVALKVLDRFKGLVTGYTCHRPATKRPERPDWSILGPAPEWLVARQRTRPPEWLASLRWRPLASAFTVAERCKQMNVFANTRGNVSEPEWYAGLGVLAYCSDGERLAHEWSAGHPNYSSDETQSKYEQASELRAPSTCERFRKLNNLCASCPFLIHTPYVLGVQ
jgi:hypothetical protein